MGNQSPTRSRSTSPIPQRYNAQGGQDQQLTPQLRDLKGQVALSSGSSVRQKKSIEDKYPDEIGQLLIKQCLKCPKTINKQKVLEIFNKLERESDYKRAQILKEEFEYTGMNAAHACCRNGHLAVLKVIVDSYPEICSVPDHDGNLALHHLCMNTTSKASELRVMLEIIKHANPGAKSKENYGNGPGGVKLTPIDILNQRFEEQNPYETNIADCRDALLNGLSQIDIDDDEKPLRQTTPALYNNLGRSPESEFFHVENHHYNSSEKILQFASTKGILRNPSAPTVGNDTSTQRKSNLKKKLQY